MSQLFIDQAVGIGPTVGNPLTQTYTPFTPVTGILLLANNLSSLTARQFAPTLNGIAMTQVAGSPFISDLANDAVLHAWFLGSGLPDDTSGISYVTNFTDGTGDGSTLEGSLIGICYTDDTFVKLSGESLQVVDVATANGTGANPSITLSHTSDHHPVALNLSGVDDVGSIDAGADTFVNREFDRGTEVAAYYSYGGSDPMAAPAGDWTLNWTAASDTYAIFGVSISPFGVSTGASAPEQGFEPTRPFLGKHPYRMRPYTKLGDLWHA